MVLANNHVFHPAIYINAQTMKAFFLPLLALVLLLSACARDVSMNVNQDSIYTEYRIVYDDDQGKSFARATFRFSGATGTILELSAPAEVTVDGEPMAWKPLLGYYEKEYAGIDSQATFLYSDLDNNTYENKVLIAKAIDFPAGLDTLSKGDAFTLSWTGAALGTNESVIVTINGANEADAKVFTQTAPGSSSIILEKNKLEGLVLGTATVLMERFTVQVLEEGTPEGGAVWSRYLADPIQVVVVE